MKGPYVEMEMKTYLGDWDVEIKIETKDSA